MSAIGSLARHTLVDALRERIFRALAGYLLLVFGAAHLLRPLALGEGRRVTLDLGLALVSLAGVLLVVLLGTRALQREIEQRTILVLLARPIARAELLLGKFFGMWAVTGVALAGMLLILGLVLWSCGYGPTPGLLSVACFALLELAILCALSLLLTNLAGPAVAGGALLALFAAGRLAPSLLEAVRMMPDSPLAPLLTGAFRLLPRLDLYTAGLAGLHGASLPAASYFWAAGYALFYCAAILLLALLALRRREFA